MSGKNLLKGKYWTSRSKKKKKKERKKKAAAGNIMKILIKRLNT